MFRSVQAVPNEIERESDPARASLFTVNSSEHCCSGERCSCRVRDPTAVNYRVEVPQCGVAWCAPFGPDGGPIWTNTALLPHVRFKIIRSRGGKIDQGERALSQHGGLQVRHELLSQPAHADGAAEAWPCLQAHGG